MCSSSLLLNPGLVFQETEKENRLDIKFKTLYENSIYDVRVLINAFP